MNTRHVHLSDQGLDVTWLQVWKGLRLVEASCPAGLSILKPAYSKRRVHLHSESRAKSFLLAVTRPFKLTFTLPTKKGVRAEAQEAHDDCCNNGCSEAEEARLPYNCTSTLPLHRTWTVPARFRESVVFCEGRLSQRLCWLNLSRS